MASDPNVPPEEARLEDANQPAATDTAATDGDEAAEKNVGVVFVHGQGSDRHPGSEFAKLLNGLVIGLQGADREYEFTVDADEKVDGIAVPSATLVVSRPHGSPRRDRFRFREAFWDDAFPPPGADEVLRWVLYGFGQAMDGVFTGWWRDPSASGFEAKEPWWKPPDPEELVGAHAVPHRAHPFLLTGIFTPLILLYDFVLRPATWLLVSASKTPVLKLLRHLALGLQRGRGLSPFMSRTLGDAKRIVSNETLGPEHPRPAWKIAPSSSSPRGWTNSSSSPTPSAPRSPTTRSSRAVDSRARLGVVACNCDCSPSAAASTTSGRSRASGSTASISAGRSPSSRSILYWSSRRRTVAKPSHRSGSTSTRGSTIVPGGGLRRRIAQQAGVEHDNRQLELARIVNDDSWVDDHGGYFSHLDQFVPRLLTSLYNSREWSQTEATPPRPQDQLTALRPNQRAQAVFRLNLMKLLPVFGLPLHLFALVTVGPWHDFADVVGGVIVDRVAAPFDALAALFGTTSELMAATLLLALLLVVVGRAGYAWSRPYIDRGSTPWFAWVFVFAAYLAAVGFVAFSLLAVVTNLVLAGLAVVGLAATSLLLLALMLALRFLLNRDSLSDRLARVKPSWVLVTRASSTAMVFVIVAAVASWFVVGGLIHRGALRLEAEKPFNVTIERSDGDDVLLSGNRNSVQQPGLLGLQWDEGYVQLGEPQPQGSLARRRIERVLSGSAPPPPGRARLDGFAFAGDPSVAYEHRRATTVAFWEVAYASVERDERNVDLRAWIVQPSAPLEPSTWVIVVHGKGGTRAEGYRMLPTLTGLGLTVMLISYRDDRESAQETDGRFEYGRTEWRDVVAAMDFATREPAPGDAVPGEAERVILYGYSMGGGIVASTLKAENEWPATLRDEGLVALVLDSPMLHFADTVEFGLQESDPTGIPQPVAGWFRRIAGRRFDIQWSQLEYIDVLAADDRPLLLIHGLEDDVVPIDNSRELHDERRDLLYVEVPDARHTLAWNVNPAAYEACVGTFLGSALARVGPDRASSECAALGHVNPPNPE